MKRISDISMLRLALTIACDRPHVATAMGMTAPRMNLSWWREGEGRRQGVYEAFKLQRLNAFDDGLHERINTRHSLLQRIQACAEDGFVAIHESGMDCDCVTFAGIYRYKVPANFYAVHKTMEEAERGADGRLHLTVIKPSEAEGVQYRSRDNVMEAYEDGHPHAVVARSPE